MTKCIYIKSSRVEIAQEMAILLRSVLNYLFLPLSFAHVGHTRSLQLQPHLVCAL